jgi:hypothetical protein
MRVYLAGPMSGHKDHNKEAFATAAADLRERGYDVVSPAELDFDEGIDISSPDGYTVSDADYAYMLRRDFEHISDCDGVAFLDGWSKSGGCGREGRYALQLELPLYVYAGPGRPLLRMGPQYFLSYSTTERRQKCD